MARVGEPVDVTDLRDEHRRQGGADPGQLLNRPITGMAPQLGGDLVEESSLVRVEDVDQLEQRHHPLRVRDTERHLFQTSTSLDAEQVRHRDQHPGLGETECTWALPPVRNATSSAL